MIYVRTLETKTHLLMSWLSQVVSGIDMFAFLWHPANINKRARSEMWTHSKKQPDGWKMSYFHSRPKLHLTVYALYIKRYYDVLCII